MDKFGRKASSDPLQEALRQHKDKWNHDASELIGGIISLKKGINGRGDKEHNLPVSSIKEPLPNEIVSYISEIASSASKLIEEAKSIVNHQENYSKNRKKKQALSKKEKEIIKMAELLSQASWWGSRFIAKIRLPQQRKMISSLEATMKSFETFEDSLLSSKDNAIPESFTKLIKIINEYTGTFFNELKLSKAIPISVSKEEKANLEKQKHEEKKLERERAEANRQLMLQEEIARKQEEKSSKEEEKTRRKIEESERQENLPLTKQRPESIKKDFSAIIADVNTAKVFINLIKKNNNLFELNVNDFDTLLQELINSLDRYNKNQEQSTSTLIDAMQKDIAARHLILARFLYLNPTFKYKKRFIDGKWTDDGKISIVDMPVSQGSSSFFNDLLRYLIEINAFQLSAQSFVDSELIKNASIANWLKSNILNIGQYVSLTDRNFKSILLNTYKSSREIRKELNSILNELESSKLSFDTIIEKTNNLNKLILDLIDNMLALASSYNASTRRQEKAKESYKYDIKSTDLTELKRLKTALSDIKFVNKSEEFEKIKADLSSRIPDRPSYEESGFDSGI